MKREKNPSDIQKEQTGRRSTSPRLRVLRDPEMLDLVFQTFEDLTTLRECCGQKVSKARAEEHLFGTLLWKEDESGLRRWSRLSEMVTTSRNLLDHTVRVNRLDPAQFQDAYRRMVQIRTAWACLEPRSPSFPLIFQITSQLRQILIRQAQA